MLLVTYYYCNEESQFFLVTSRQPNLFIIDEPSQGCHFFFLSSSDLPMYLLIGFCVSSYIIGVTDVKFCCKRQIIITIVCCLDFCPTAAGIVVKFVGGVLFEQFVNSFFYEIIFVGLIFLIS